MPSCNVRGRAYIVGATQPQLIQALSDTGSWAAMVWNTGAKMGHWVVVDALDDAGSVAIRDPRNASRCSVTLAEFLEYWTENAVCGR
jgi:hypothetical protein